MGSIASLITSLTSVYSTVHSGADQRKHKSSASLAFVWGIHRRPVNSPHKWPVSRKMFPFVDAIMCRRILFFKTSCLIGKYLMWCSELPGVFILKIDCYLSIADLLCHVGTKKRGIYRFQICCSFAFLWPTCLDIKYQFVNNICWGFLSCTSMIQIWYCLSVWGNKTKSYTSRQMLLLVRDGRQIENLLNHSCVWDA